jgi:cysteinyl-tRNA synthetase
MFTWITRLWKKPKDASPRRSPLYLKNNLSDTKEVFVPFKTDMVRLYTCGPTMYGPVHIGNLRAVVFPDILVRVLTGLGYRVRQVINITDFGHLVTDGDAGEDKMTKGLLREHMALTLENMRALSEKYTKVFLDDLESLGVDIEQIDFPRASDYIPQQIALIKTLEQKGYAYTTKDGVYFDTSRFPDYGKLGDVQLLAQKGASRVEQRSKRHPADFVLWKPDSKIGWESPWGLGFPGWHIECSAMIRTLLGQEIDIHTGGEDLMHVHHNNEIAQSEAANGRKFVHYWMHNAFLTMHGEKASKSLGNVVYLSEIKEKGIHPLALRYFFLQAHYSTPLSFSWDALHSAENALERLWKMSRDIAEESDRVGVNSEIRERFLSFMRDDLSTPQALGMLWETLRSEDHSAEEKWGLIESAETHFGLLLTNPPENKVLNEADIPQNVQSLLAERESARARKDFKEADRLRNEIENSGYRVEDGPSGPVLSKTTV